VNPAEHSETDGRRSYVVAFDTVEELAVTYSQQITRGCLFLPTTHFVPLGTTVELRVQPPNKAPPVVTVARVDSIIAPETAERLRRQPGIGLELMEPHATEFAKAIVECLQGAEEDEAAPATEPASATILVVDDDRRYRDQVAAALEEAGYEVATAKDGLDGLGRAVAVQPDMVLTDVQMPGMNGWQLLRMLRARPQLKSTGIIFLTDLKSDQERLKAYKLGVDDFLQKPISEDELRLRVGRVLRSAAVVSDDEASERTLRGDIASVALASVLSLVEMEKRNGILTVSSDRGVAQLYIDAGNVIHVELTGEAEATEPGLERMREVLGWTHGRFELVDTTVGDTEPTIHVPTSYALLECARVTDEQGR
jgi:CheY-like chemotaxis protein